MGVFLIMVLIGTPVYLFTIGASPWIIGASALLAGLIVLWFVWPTVQRWLNINASQGENPEDGRPSSHPLRNRRVEDGAPR